TTRSFSDLTDEFMEMVLLALRLLPQGVLALWGSWCLSNPLSAQAQAPSRPSGADKQQEPAENQGSIRPGLKGPRSDRANQMARRHCPKSSLSASPGWRKRVNSALTVRLRLALCSGWGGLAARAAAGRDAA